VNRRKSSKIPLREATKLSVKRSDESRSSKAFLDSNLKKKKRFKTKRKITAKKPLGTKKSQKTKRSRSRNQLINKPEKKKNNCNKIPKYFKFDAIPKMGVCRIFEYK